MQLFEQQLELWYVQYVIRSVRGMVMGQSLAIREMASIVTLYVYKGFARDRKAWVIVARPKRTSNETGTAFKLSLKNISNPAGYV